MSGDSTGSVLPIDLVPGLVLHMVDYAHDEPKPHYYVLLNVSPDQDTWLVTAMATSKVEKVKAHLAHRGLPPSTAVEVTPETYVTRAICAA